MANDGLREYWTRVGSELATRAPAGQTIAGDDTPFQRHKAMRCGQLFDTVPVESRSVLEVGCGPGGNLSRMANQAPRRLVGCDISSSMLEVARSNVGHDVPLVQIDGKRLPFADAAFDVVFTVTVLQHDNDAYVAAMLAEAARVSRRWIFLFEDIAPRRKDQPGYVRRPVEDYARPLERRGFRLDEHLLLPVHVSETVARAARRVLPKTEEGVPARRSVHRFESGALPITRLLDRVLPARQGLCRMSFQRSQPHTTDDQTDPVGADPRDS